MPAQKNKESIVSGQPIFVACKPSKTLHGVRFNHTECRVVEGRVAFVGRNFLHINLPRAGGLVKLLLVPPVFTEEAAKEYVENVERDCRFSMSEYVVYGANRAQARSRYDSIKVARANRKKAILSAIDQKDNAGAKEIERLRDVIGRAYLALKNEHSDDAYAILRAEFKEE